MITLFLIELVLLLILAAAVENENDFGAALIIIAGVTAAFFLTWTNPLLWIVDNINVIAASFVGYFIVGAAWSVFKYWRWMESEEVTTRITLIRKELEKEGTPADPSLVTKEFFEGRIGRDSKSKISRWIVLWPASLTWALTFKLIDNTWKAIYESLKGLYESITRTVIERLLR